MVIVINSLNKDYVKKAEKYCKDVGIEYYITESNGTPAKGKNSVLDLFLASDNDYCVMIDGDDFLTQYGVEYYKSLENKKIVPDALCLRNGMSIQDKEGKSILVSLRAKDKKFDFEEFKTSYKKKHDATEEQTLKATEDVKKMYETQERLSEKNQTFTRVTWLSKKAAKYTFDEDLVIGEDAIQFLKLKNAAVKNRLKFYTLDESIPTYIYDHRTLGTVKKETKESTDFDWINSYIKKLKIMDSKNELHENTYLREYKVICP
jgi:phage tail tube protein FII